MTTKKVWKRFPNSNKQGEIPCVMCGTMFTPSNNQYGRAKYCSKQCNWRNKARVRRATRGQRGGYNRETYIKLWLNAMRIDYKFAPCHYCYIPVTVETFVIDHKVPRKDLEPTREAQEDITNLVVCCESCNNRKNTDDYETFKARMAPVRESNVSLYTRPEYFVEKIKRLQSKVGHLRDWLAGDGPSKADGTTPPA